MAKVTAGATKTSMLQRWFGHRLWRLRSQLLIVALVLLSLPYLGYRFIDATNGLLQQSQAMAQQHVSQSLANLFSQRPQLLLQLPELSAQQPLLFVQPINQSKQIDGLIDDWQTEMVQAAEFINADAGIHFTSTLGLYQSQLYGKLHVYDQHWLNPSRHNTGWSVGDHVRIAYVDGDDQEHELALLAESPGTMVIYALNSDGQIDFTRPLTQLAIKAALQLTHDGYFIEWQMSISLLGDTQLLRLSVIDADDTTAPARMLTTQGPEAHGYTALNTLSNQAMALLAGQQESPMSVTLYDRQLNRLAHTGHIPLRNNDMWNWNLSELWHQLYSGLINQIVALTNPVEGDPKVQRPRLLNLALGGIVIQDRWPMQQTQGIQATAMPIFADKQQVIGVVLVEQAIDQLMQIQRQTMEQVVLVSLTTAAIIMLTLVLLFWRLALRIRTLGQQTHALVDASGRLQTGQLAINLDDQDEIGDLARDIANVMQRLQQHQRFMAQIPRTLSHEIKNPLNTISTSLGNLKAELAQHPSEEYILSAQRGLYKIESILNKLASAASLEQALEQESKETIDVAHLLSSYCRYQAQSVTQLHYQGPEQGVQMEAVDYRLEQALDKLLDNAKDFRAPDTPITITLRLDGPWASIQFCNQGPAIDAEQAQHLFHSMVSQRATANEGGEGHFGLGLFVVRTICEHHGGQVSWRNKREPEGVCFELRLPIKMA